MAGFLRSRAAALGALEVFALAAALGIGAFGLVTPACAQGFGWFGNLFGGGPPRPAAAPQVRGYSGRPDGYRASTRSPRRHRSDSSDGLREHETVVRDKDRPPQKRASAFVDVVGDSFGQNLASGLDEALADRPDVAVIHLAKGSTGLVATDFYDWPKAIDALLAADPKKPTLANDHGKGEPTGADASAPVASGPAPAPAKDETKPIGPTPIDVAVMMIGSNDRQPIRLGGTILKPGTLDWVAAYTKRVMAIDEAFQRKGIPLIWVGVPITRDDGFADDMAAFNDIYREAAAKTGAVYVDTWEAFSDDDGDFSAVGPDVNGQMTRLRSADGVYFTKAGSRKLAHFVEVHVRRALDGKMVRPLISELPASPAILPRKPEIGPISNLEDPPLSRDGRLATAYHVEASHEPSSDTPIVKGSPQAVPTGRADDFKWPATGMPNP